MSANVLPQQQKRKPNHPKASIKIEPPIALEESNQIVGRTLWDVLSSALKRPAVTIPISLGVLGGLTFLTVSGYAQASYGEGGLAVKIGPPNNPTSSVTVERAATLGLEKRITYGRSLNRPYVLDDVTVLIRLKDIGRGANRERQVNWRIVYTVRALQAISRNDKLFKERYSTDSARIMRWFGTEREIKATDDAYNVMMDIPAGETRTIVTGATFVYSLPLQNDRPAFGQSILLTQDQEFFSYPNEEDVIGELTILIESDDVMFSPVGQSAKRSRADGSIAPDEEYRFNDGNSRSLSAHWKNVMPKEEVGLHYRVEHSEKASLASK